MTGWRLAADTQDQMGRVLVKLLGRLARTAPHARVKAAWLNGAPALLVEIDGKVDVAVNLGLGGGRITGIYAIRNPEKLNRLGEAVRLSRGS